LLSSRKTFSQFCRIHYRACSIIACTLVAGSLVILIGTPIGLDGPLLDVLIKTRAIVFPRDISPAKSPVAVIALDVRSLNEPELAPYPRTLLAPVWATLLDAVMKAGAQAVGFDLVFAYSANRFSPNFDRPFLEMLDRHRARVVLGRSMTTLPAPPFLGAPYALLKMPWAWSIFPQIGMGPTDVYLLIF